MHGAFDDVDDFKQQRSHGDAELTLGAGMLLLLFGALIVVCGMCFGFGYIVGHRGATSVANQLPASAPAAQQTSSTQPKPSANTQAAVPAPVQPASQPDAASSNDPPQLAAAVANPVASAQTASAPAGQPQVRPALPYATPAQQPENPYSSRAANSADQSQVQPESKPLAGQLWVQIAAVSHVEDAQVLTNALKRRGYTVTPRREGDNLIHVRIGPFTTPDEANRMRSKLLDDGYNAEVQQ